MLVKHVMKHYKNYLLIMIICLFLSASIECQGAVKESLNYSIVTVKPNTTLKLSVNSKKKIVWTSKNTKVASVSKNGLVKGKKKGKTVITAKVNNKVLKCNVTVGIPVKSIVLTSQTNVMVEEDATAQVACTVMPVNSSNRILEYKSMNTKIAEVSESGQILGVNEGETDIVIKSTDGSDKKAKVHVFVLAKKEDNNTVNDNDKKVPVSGGGGGNHMSDTSPQNETKTFHIDPTSTKSITIQIEGQKITEGDIQNKLSQLENLSGGKETTDFIMSRESSSTPWKLVVKKSGNIYYITANATSGDVTITGLNLSQNVKIIG